MWFGLALGSALFIALQAVYIKKISLHFNAFIVTWSILAISSLFYLPLLFTSTIPSLNTAFWVAVVGRLLVDSIGLVCYVKGLKMAPLSLGVPLVALVPLCILVLSFFINHLFPNVLGLLGIVVVMLGLYFLHFDHDTKHILSPLFALKNNRGMQYILIFVISQGFVNSFQRLAIDNSNVYFYTSFFQLFWALCFTPLAFFVNPKEFKKVFKAKNIIKLIPVGAFDAIQVFVYNLGLSIALPVYMQSVQNSSILLTSLFGWLFFKEKIKNHLVPTICIVLGITLLAFTQGN